MLLHLSVLVMWLHIYYHLNQVHSQKDKNWVSPLGYIYSVELGMFIHYNFFLSFLPHINDCNLNNKVLQVPISQCIQNLGWYKNSTSISP